jgi:hypothetical protein
MKKWKNGGRGHHPSAKKKQKRPISTATGYPTKPGKVAGLQADPKAKGRAKKYVPPQR